MQKGRLDCHRIITLGGDPEVARMMGEDIRFHSENSPNCRFVFLGKAAIYSAGTTFMSFFAVENRYLTRGTRLMVHERRDHLSNFGSDGNDVDIGSVDMTVPVEDS
jgi:hypothetical protein